MKQDLIINHSHDTLIHTLSILTPYVISSSCNTTRVTVSFKFLIRYFSVSLFFCSNECKSGTVHIALLRFPPRKMSIRIVEHGVQAVKYRCLLKSSVRRQPPYFRAKNIE